MHKLDTYLVCNSGVKGQKMCENDSVVNRGVCREGMIGVLSRRLHKC